MCSKRIIAQDDHWIRADGQGSPIRGDVGADISTHVAFAGIARNIFGAIVEHASLVDAVFICSTAIDEISLGVKVASDRVHSHWWRCQGDIRLSVGKALTHSVNARDLGRTWIIVRAKQEILDTGSIVVDGHGWIAIGSCAIAGIIV